MTFHPGDFVEVKTPDEILRTLDAEGAIDHVPFMPEMLEFCGRRFQVARHVVTTCLTGHGSPRSFNANDVFTLDGLRCSGAAHDGCQKACMIFWREAWLRKVEAPPAQSTKNAQSYVDLPGTERLRARLKVLNGSKAYFCQASELLKATYHLSTRLGKLRAYFWGLRAGNYNFLQILQFFAIWLRFRLYLLFFGVYAHGSNKSSPKESLRLRSGEWVEVKSLENIIQTLNINGLHGGLSFTPDMGRACGKRYRVKGRIDKIIIDGTGEMRQLRDTVCLEGGTCGCAYLGLGMGGCSRNEYSYWREIWLRRFN